MPATGFCFKQKSLIRKTPAVSEIKKTPKSKKDKTDKNPIINSKERKSFKTSTPQIPDDIIRILENGKTPNTRKQRGSPLSPKKRIALASLSKNESSKRIRKRIRTEKDCKKSKAFLYEMMYDFYLTVKKSLLKISDTIHTYDLINQIFCSYVRQPITTYHNENEIFISGICSFDGKRCDRRGVIQENGLDITHSINCEKCLKRFGN